MLKKTAGQNVLGGGAGGVEMLLRGRGERLFWLRRSRGGDAQNDCGCADELGDRNRLAVQATDRVIPAEDIDERDILHGLRPVFALDLVGHLHPQDRLVERTHEDLGLARLGESGNRRAGSWVTERQGAEEEVEDWIPAELLHDERLSLTGTSVRDAEHLSCMRSSTQGAAPFNRGV